MKRSITFSILSVFLLGTSALIAQNVTEFERLYYFDPDPIEEGDYNFNAKNVVAEASLSKFALTIENNSSDFLLYTPKESAFKYSAGEKSVDLKPYFIDPGKKKTKTIKADGGDQFRQKNFSFDLGGLYQIPSNGNITEAPEFQLPANKNSFTVGNFKVNLRKYDASTREAKAAFEVTYTGDDFAIINPANLSVKAKHKKTGDELMYANDDSKADQVILQKGEKTKFNAVFHIEGRIVDMQFAIMFIQWNDTFVETKAELLDTITFDFEMNEALTKEKK